MSRHILWSFPSFSALAVWRQIRKIVRFFYWSPPSGELPCIFDIHREISASDNSQNQIQSINSIFQKDLYAEDPEWLVFMLVTCKWKTRTSSCYPLYVQEFPRWGMSPISSLSEPSGHLGCSILALRSLFLSLFPPLGKRIEIKLVLFALCLASRLEHESHWG